ncbi:histidine kinase A domain protein [Bacteriovorax sp. DB6_IX]|nr:histidine kinase A domain protein [Bacteriovorax sp. DB6_IX]
MIGNGTVGGYMNNPVTHGEEVANLALRLISGDSISTMPVIEKTKYSPQSDYNQLVRFQISKSSLPSESKIFFRPISYYEDNKLAINIVLFVIAVLISFIIILNRLVIKRTRQANQTAQRLAKSNAKMKEFVGIVAHDLRAPVGNILSFTKALEEAPEDQEEIVPYII